MCAMKKPMNQMLIIIRGNSCSGKTTVAKKLQQKMGNNTMLIPQDFVRREMLGTKDVDGNPSIQLTHDIAMFGKNANYSVIVEGIFINKRYGDMIRHLVTVFDQVFVYYFDISFNETLRRHQNKPDAYEFGEKEMRGWWQEKDLLGVAGEKLITDDMSEVNILSMIQKDLGLIK